MRSHDLLAHAYGVAFNLTIAIFPAVILIFTLIPYIPLPELESGIISLLQNSMPAGLYAVLSPTIQDTLGTQRKGLLSLGFFFTLYLATNGMMSLINTFDLLSQHEAERSRSYLKKRSVAMVLILVLTLGIFASIFILLLGRQIVGQTLEEYITFWPAYVLYLSGVKLCAATLVLLSSISLIYGLAPSYRRGWPFFSVGAVVAAFLSLGASFLFSHYIRSVSHYNRIYGSIGLFIALMIWLLILSFILLLGFELNASVDASIQKSMLEGKKQPEAGMDDIPPK